MRAALLVAVVLAAAAGGFAVARATDGHAVAPGRYADGYRAGREDAFSGFDGGWILGDPYIVILERGGAGITYRFARRWPLLAGREYRACDRDFICSRRTPAR